jgi:hypothetical protein
MSRGCGRGQRTRWGATQVEPVALRPAGVPPILDAGTGPGVTVKPRSGRGTSCRRLRGAPGGPSVVEDRHVLPVEPQSRLELVTADHAIAHPPAGGFRLSTPPPVAASE